MKLKDVIEKNKKAILERHQTKSAVENPPEVQEFMEALDLAIVSQSDDSRLIEADGFHPSSLGIKSGKCQRRNVYLLRGTPREPITNPRTQRIFGNGHAVHDRLQKYLEKMDGINFQTEVVIEYENPPIRGHADGVFEWDGKKILREIKSCNQDVFDNRYEFIVQHFILQDDRRVLFGEIICIYFLIAPRIRIWHKDRGQPKEGIFAQ